MIADSLHMLALDSATVRAKLATNEGYHTCALYRCCCSPWRYTFFCPRKAFFSNRGYHCCGVYAVSGTDRASSCDPVCQKRVFDGGKVRPGLPGIAKRQGRSLFASLFHTWRELSVSLTFPPTHCFSPVRPIQACVLLLYDYTSQLPPIASWW